jgi:putative acyl-CoA dehydrogenase
MSKNKVKRVRAAIGIEEGVVGIAYARQLGEWSRLHQVAKGYLFHPSSAFVSCPFAMTDGAAKTIEVSYHFSLLQFQM